MGIRCCCPNGHKLNVKAEQAGKMGICPICKLRFQIPFGNAQTPVREKKSRSSKRDSAEDPSYLEPLPTLEDSLVSTNKSAETPSSPESRPCRDHDLSLDEIVYDLEHCLDLEPLPTLVGSQDSTNHPDENPFLKSPGLKEELGNSVAPKMSTTSSGESERDDGLGCCCFFLLIVLGVFLVLFMIAAVIEMPLLAIIPIILLVAIGDYFGVFDGKNK